MANIKYSVSADMDAASLESEVGDYGYAKFLYDRWNNDPEVFNVIMYRHEEGKRIMLSNEEVNGRFV